MVKLAFACLVSLTAALPDAADWIVVGGGASGCTAAAALADAGANVLVLERGPSDKDVPSTQSGHTWSEVVAEAVENIRWTEGAWGSVAKVLGGGASVNDGYFFEETPDWVEAVLQLSGQDSSDYFSSSRWLADRLLTPLPQSEYGKHYAEALSSAGHGTADYSDVGNIRYKDGAWVVNSLFNLTDPAWPRNTPAILLHERSGMQNLEVATGVQVQKVNFEGTRAVSVSVTGDAGSQMVQARKGIIMAAGAIYTPQLLQVSGVGEAALLSKLGVTQIAELPVGKNFVDRLTWTIQIIAPHALEKYLGFTVAADEAAGLTFESVGGASVDSYMAIPSLGLAPAKNREEYLRPIMKFIMEDTPIAKLMDRFSNVLALVQDTKSRGSVEASSTDSTVPPTVSANYFAEQEDIDSQVANLKRLIEVARQSSLDDYRMTTLLDALDLVWPVGLLSISQINDLIRAGINLLPDLNGLPDFLAGIFTCQAYGFVSVPCPPKDESRWGDWLKENVLSTYHYFGTAAVGSVVEPGSFTVKGTQGLYVVDASVIPQATRVNPVGTVMTLGHFVGSKLGRDGVSVHV